MKREKPQHWDLIGDIHGEHTSLVRLLEELGYHYDHEAVHFFHPEGRKVIFVGDFIDRGPDSRSVLHLVRGMIDAGHALAVMGNHEFNFVSYFTPDPEGGYLRPHHGNYPGQIEATLASFDGNDEEIPEWVEWMKGLPFFLELDGLRVVHASWIAEDIEYLREKSLHDGAFLIETNRKGSRARQAIDNVLKGVELPLPDGVSFADSNGIQRNNMRIQWWGSGKGESYRELSFPPNDLAPDAPVPEGAEPAPVEYGPGEPPVFFGHYKLKRFAPFSAAPNIASLDYGLGHGGKATAYRWSGEAEIDAGNFVQVNPEPPAAYELYSDDNFHFMDEDERVKLGEFGTYAAAVQKAKEIVDRYLQNRLHEGNSAEEAASSWRSFGDDPFLPAGPKGVPIFSASSYVSEWVRKSETVATLPR